MSEQKLQHPLLPTANSSMLVSDETKKEIIEQMSHVRKWGGKFVVPIPEVQVYP